MAVSNTYIEPTAGTSLNTARGQFNDSMRAILTNFKALGTPGVNQFYIDGAPTTEQDGMLYRSEKTNALYISDSVHKKTSPVGGNFTRWGIGHRVEASATAFNSATTRATYEIGELVGVLDTGKLYIRNSNTDSAASFVDVGTTQGYTVSGPFSNATFTGQSLTGINIIATNSLTVGTDAPTQPLDIRGNASITGNTFIGNLVYHNGDLNSFFGFPVGTTDTYVLATSGAERVRVDSAGRSIFGHTAVLDALNDVGAAYIPAIQNIGTTRDESSYAGFNFQNNANGPIISLVKSRGTTKGSNVAVASSDNLGSIIFTGVDGSNNIENAARIGAQADGAPTANAVSGRLMFYTANATGMSEQMRITSAGYVGINKITPLYELDVGGTIRASTNIISLGTLEIVGAITSNSSITASGNITAYSDARLKTDISTIDNALEKVSKLRGVYFTKDSVKSMGVIAQEIEPIIPEVVQNGVYKSVAYGNIVGLLIEAIKELKAEVDELKRGK